MFRRYALSISCFVAVAMLSASAHAGKMELPLRMLAEKPTLAKAVQAKTMKAQDGSELVGVLIKTEDWWETEMAIAESGGFMRSVVGEIITAFVPIGALSEIEARPEVVAMEASKRMKLMMDTARSSNNTNVEAAQAAGFDGENVVVGVIDSGLDYSRSDFDASGGGTRVQYLRFQSVASDGSVSITECAKDYIDDGDCTIAASNDATVGHGTHVTGIAAGSNSTYTGVAPAADIMLVRNDFYDDIDEGGATSGTFTGGVIDGVVEIFEKADFLDKPAVINISQGTHIGAHDNTSLLEEAMNEAVTGGYASNGKAYGRAITVAAGNESMVTALAGGYSSYVGGIHADVNVPSGSAHAWRLWVLVSSAGRTPLAIDSWFDVGTKNNCTVAANAYYANEVFDSLPPPVAKAGVTTDDARVVIADAPLNADASDSASDNTAGIAAAVDAEDSLNGKPRAIMLFGPNDGSDWGTDWTDLTIGGGAGNGYVLDFIVRASGGSCTGDIWIEGGDTYVNFARGISTGAFDIGAGANGAVYEIQDGDSNSTISIPGTASGVITAGSYLQYKDQSGCPSTSCWTDSGGTQYDATDTSDLAVAGAAQINGGTVLSRSPFSSIGPVVYSYSGRKPDVLAPGDPIISVLPTGHSVGAALQVDSTHYKSQGTSQASPHVAGIVALMFQKNNTITAAQAKTAITSTATQSSSPDNSSGYGNAKANSALAALGADDSGYSGTGDLTQADLDGGGGGGTGSSSCGGQLVPGGGIGFGPEAALLLASIACLGMMRRRRRG